MYDEENDLNQPVTIGDYVKIVEIDNPDILNSEGEVICEDGEKFIFVNDKFIFTVYRDCTKWKIIKKGDARYANVFDLSVYAILHSQTIDEMIEGLRKLEMTEGRPWTQTQKDLALAKECNKDMYCLLAPAENTTFLYAYGKIEKIEIEGKITRCTFSEIHKFPPETLYKEAVIKKNLETIPYTYIKSYIPCLVYSALEYLFTHENGKEIENKQPAPDAGNGQPEKKEITTTAYERDSRIRAAALKRAKGHCDLCHNCAPFKDKNGEPYLEGHHIIPLEDGGPDTLENMAALCPNCHRLLHYADDELRKNKSTYLYNRNKNL